MPINPIKNILILTDFSKNSHNAMVYAISFFGELKCNFYLLNSFGNSIIKNKFNYGNLKSAEELREAIALANKIKKNKYHKFYPLCESMNLIEAVRSNVQNKKIDFITVGRNGSSECNKIGSNTREIIAKVQCPIIVIPERANFLGIKSIAFPTDFNCVFKSKVVTTILELLVAYKARLEILDVQSGHQIYSDQQNHNKTFLLDFMKDLPTNLHTVHSCNIENVIHQLHDNGQLDLIAVMAKNLNLMERLLFSPTASAENYCAKIPFLVLHEFSSS